MGKFLLFINFRQAASLGHVGWGFLLDDNATYLFGSTDHLYRHQWWDLPAWLSYMHVEPGEPTDWWCEYGNEDEMYTRMSRSHNHIWYHSCKSVLVPKATPKIAEKMALGQELGGWSLLSNNCVGQTFELIKAYGAETKIPDPWQNSLNMIPRVWFDSFNGEVKQLNPL